jgi:HK97 family phage major capsid protein
VDATAIALFATAGYVTAFDTTIFRWEGAITIGLDFLSDTPIDFGGTITRQYGERLLEDLDNAIATGNGTNQPQGIMNAAGTTTVAFGGATSLGAYETMLFSVAKAEHKSNVVGSACFCGTETSYSRARGLSVTATDERRLAAGEANQGDYRSYKWMGRNYAINESLTNAQIFYFIGARYRMYRRKGFTVRTSTEGATLIRDNSMLISVTARYGGQLERGACAAVTTTAPA